MESKETTTRERILTAGKEEFLSNGFKNASLRSIAKRAGVTTGAIYGYYTNKHALFEALVADPATALLEKFITIAKELDTCSPQEQVQSLNEKTSTTLDWMVDHIYDHFFAFKLVICCGAGTCYENYIDQLVEIEIKSTKKFIETIKRAGIKPSPIEDDLIRILANALFSGTFEAVRQDMDKHKAQAYLGRLTEFNIAGWEKILGIQRS